MSKEERKELTPEEIEEQNGEMLPDREQLSMVQPIEQMTGGAVLPIEPEE